MTQAPTEPPTAAPSAETQTQVHTMAQADAALDEMATAWRDRPDISARSVLVTVLGDTVAPLGGSIWLADLIRLAEVFGFSDRLVRTSMFRLAAEGWVTNERVGRRSRYSLTEFSRAEIADASTRIYRRVAPTWDGQWTLAFVDASAGEADEPSLEQSLRWHGFAPIAAGVFAKPNADAVAARSLFARLGVEPAPMVATAAFDAVSPVAATATFRTESGLARAEAAYRDIVDGYGWTDSLVPGDLPPRSAFLLRSMIVHDLRRSRLGDPELPIDLLPADWIGSRAAAIASHAYEAVDRAAWRWVESITGLTPDPLLTDRFTSPPDPRTDTP